MTTRCLCLTHNSKGRQCTRNTSTKVGDNHSYCWQHQKCRTDVDTIKSASTSVSASVTIQHLPLFVVYKYINQTDYPSKIRFVGTLPQIVEYLTKLKSYKKKSATQITQSLIDRRDVSTDKGYGGHFLIPWTPQQPVDPNPIKLLMTTSFSGHYLVEHQPADELDVYVYEYHDLESSMKKYEELKTPVEEEGGYLTLYHLIEGDPCSFEVVASV